MKPVKIPIWYQSDKESNNTTIHDFDHHSRFKSRDKQSCLGHGLFQSTHRKKSIVKQRKKDTSNSGTTNKTLLFRR